MKEDPRANRGTGRNMKAYWEADFWKSVNKKKARKQPNYCKTDSDIMCDSCDCWKKTRSNCS